MRIPDSMVTATLRQLKDHARRRRAPTLNSGEPQRNSSDPKLNSGEIRKFDEDAFLYGISSDHLKATGIRRGDQLVIDQTRVPASGDFVLVWRSSEGATIKRLRKRRGVHFLESDHRLYLIDSAAGDKIWGVVTGVVHPIGAKKSG